MRDKLQKKESNKITTFYHLSFPLVATTLIQYLHDILRDRNYNTSGLSAGLAMFVSDVSLGIITFRMIILHSFLSSFTFQMNIQISVSTRYKCSKALSYQAWCTNNCNHYAGLTGTIQITK